MNRQTSLTKEQLQSVLAKARAAGPRDYAMLVLASTYAMRAGELAKQGSSP